MDYEIHRPSPQCSVTGRELAEDEPFYSVLIAAGHELRRQDYAPEAWQGPPEGAIGWWKSRVPRQQAKRAGLAPNDALVELFVQVAERPQQADFRYVVALLLLRRRLARLEETELDTSGGETLVLYLPREERTYRVPVTHIDESRAAELQDELARLLLPAEAADGK